MPRHNAAWEYGGSFEGLVSGSDVAVTVELETPFLFVVPLVEGE